MTSQRDYYFPNTEPLAPNEMRIIELNVFALTLAIQSLPYLAATLMAAIENYESSSLGRHLPLARLSPAK